MELTKKDITEYQILYKQKFGKDLDSQTARTQLSKLVRQMEIVYQPITKKQFDEFQEREFEIERDANALAELIYDMYQEEKKTKKDRSSS